MKSKSCICYSIDQKETENRSIVEWKKKQTE